MNATAKPTFNLEQTEYLKGFFTGVAQRDVGIGFVGSDSAGKLTGDPALAEHGNLAAENVHGVPLEDLTKEELIKHEKHGLDVWADILDHAARDRFPEGGDVFRWKFHGLFHVKPTQDSLMLRCRIPGGVLRDFQMDALADLTESYGPGHSHITTRGNIQIREIQPRDSMNVLLGLRDAGLTSQGAGADNIRNITASPASGIDPDEIYDVLPLARAMHHYILNNRELYDLPRKFNISFDNGGAASVCADTNDIAFRAVRLRPGAVPDWLAGETIGFRVELCGITGHKQSAFDAGLLVTAAECIPVAAAMLRVFRKHGDRTNRKHARMKYLLDDWGLEKFLAATASELAFDLRYATPETCEPRQTINRTAHLGAYPQRQEGKSWLGVRIPVGRMEAHQMRALADIARRFGRGELRLTVWQNVIIPHLPTDQLDTVRSALATAGLDDHRHGVAAALVACTGSRGCKYSSTDTKSHAVQLADYLQDRITLADPINIHFTGCPHSCAQHYIGDIGLVGCKVERGDEKIEGYHIVLGGGTGSDQGIAREAFSSVPFDDVPPLIEKLLLEFQARAADGERFIDFTRRLNPEELRTLTGAVA